MIEWRDLLSKVKNGISITEQGLFLIRRNCEGKFCNKLFNQLVNDVVDTNDLKETLVDLLAYEVYNSKKYNAGMKPMIPQATLELKTKKDLEKFVSWYMMNSDYKTIYRFIDFNEIADMYLTKVAQYD